MLGKRACPFRRTTSMNYIGNAYTTCTHADQDCDNEPCADKLHQEAMAADHDDHSLYYNSNCCTQTDSETMSVVSSDHPAYPMANIFGISNIINPVIMMDNYQNLGRSEMQQQSDSSVFAMNEHLSDDWRRVHGYNHADEIMISASGTAEQAATAAADMVDEVADLQYKTNVMSVKAENCNFCILDSGAFPSQSDAAADPPAPAAQANIMNTGLGFIPDQERLWAHYMNTLSAHTMMKSPHLHASGISYQNDCNLEFLKACFFCKRRLRQERDIFMYRGDTAFCSEECRHRQIRRDEKRSLQVDKKKRSPETAVAA